MNTPRNLRVASFLAVRSLARGNLGVTMMTVVMLAVVFISVVFLPSLINGAVANIKLQVTNTATSDLVVTPADRAVIDRADSLLREIRGTEGVAAATGVRRVGNQVAFRGDSNAWGVDAIDPESYAAVFTTPGNLIEGEWLRPGDVTGIVLGIDIAGADLTDRRGYVGSLRHVHAGDTVTVTLIGGDTKRLVVRGVFDNRFVLSDQGAFVTAAVADAVDPATDLASAVDDTFDALDELAGSVGEAAEATAGIAEGQAAVTDAADRVAEGAGSLAKQVRSLDLGADEVASSARQAADAARQVGGGAEALRRNLADLGRQLEQRLVPTADQAADEVRTAAEAAAALAAACPAQTTDPAHCAAEKALAEDLAEAATTAGTSAVQLHAVLKSVGGLADASADLVEAAHRLESAASAVAKGSGKVADGTEATVVAAGTLADTADSVATSSARLTRSARDLARSLAKAADAEGPSQEEQDKLTRALRPQAAIPGAGTATRIFVKAAPGASPSRLQEAIGPMRSDVELRSSQELTASIQDQIETFTLINNIMRVISLIVAAITVFILTYVELTNRRRQIGIERAIGIRGVVIVLSYVLKSAISALIGIALGIAAYRLAIMPFVDRHPFQFPNGAVVLVAEPATIRQSVVMLLVVAVLAALVPTLNAVRMRILDAIWGR